MSDLMPPINVLMDTFFIFLGGLWYILIAMIFLTIRPFRPIQRALGDCISETAAYLMIKSDLYDLNKNLDEAYSRLIQQQTVVNEKQIQVRDLLFRNRSVLKESTFEGRLLVVTFVATVDLFEQIMATWYDYTKIRNKYKDLNVLDKISNLIKGLASELKDIGESIHSQIDYKKELNLIEELNRLKTETEKILAEPLDFTLRKIIINLRNLGNQIDSISRYFSARKSITKTNLDKRDYSKFVSHQKINLPLFLDNLSMKSSAFRHSLRVMITCTIGYILSKTFMSGEHSYWIIMTIIIILKPAYSLTKSKNIDRLTGTVAGGIIGLLLLNFIHNDNLLFVLLTFFILGTYTFVRINYAVMVIFLTPYVLILFHFLGKNIINIAGERLLDTAIACVLSYMAIHFLFPNWESQTIKNSLAEVLKANIKYLANLRELIYRKELPMASYRLQRREVFVTTANLSAALHRMQSEPKSKQQFKGELYELVVLNHVLSSNIASLANSIMTDPKPVPKRAANQIENSIINLEKTVHTIDPEFNFKLSQPAYNFIPDDQDTNPLEEQINFIEKITLDIRRIGNLLSNTFTTPSAAHR